MAAMFVNGSKRNQHFPQRTFHGSFLTDWDKMSNLYKRTFHRCFLPSFGSFGHAVSEEIFQKQTNQNHLWWPCLLMDGNRMCNLYRDLPWILPTKFRSIWPSCVRVEDFQKLTNQKKELSVVAMFVNRLEQNEQSL